MAWTEKELICTVNALLSEGVPSGVVARVFDLDEGLVKQQQKRLRIDRYGTADMDEYMEQMQWDAIENARQVLATGTNSERARFVNQVLGRGLASQSRRVSDSVREGRERLVAELESMKSGGPTEAPETERSRFVVVGGGKE